MMIFVLYYNHQRKLKSLKYQTHFDIIMLKFERNSSNFNHNPNYMLLGLNNNLIPYTYSAELCVLYRSLCSFRNYTSWNAFSMILIRQYNRILT
ncbi:hypothetical protein P618_200362 [Holospora obtusa F1]|uniref:Uncharacterized protein n=1 Tax=Holospora obtusa F1 TaxID=1399147 RepID=W6TEY4_HOLOB|nr:hypothetical protein P618_200362 [Holospora obtusa F1]